MGWGLPNPLDVISSAVDTVREGVNTVVEGARDLGNNVIAAAETTIDDARRELGNLRRNAGEVLDNVQQAVVNFPSNVMNTANDALQMGRDSLNQAIEAIQNIPANIRDTVQDQIKQAQEILQKTEEMLKEAQEQMRKFPDQAKEIFDEAVRLHEEATKQALEHLRNLPQNVRDVVEEAIEEGANVLTEGQRMLDDARKYIDEELEKLPANAAAAFATVQNTVSQRIEGAIQSVNDAIDTAAENLAKIPGKLEAALDSVVETATAYAEQAVQVINDTGNSLLHAVLNPGETLMNLAVGLYELGNSVVEMVGDAITWCVETAQWLDEKIQQGVDWCKENITWDNFCAVCKNIYDTAVKIDKWLQDTGKWLLEKGWHYITHPGEIVDAVVDAYKWCKDIEKKCIDWCVKTLEKGIEWASKWENWEKLITDGATAIYEFGESLVNGYINAFKEGLEFLGNVALAVVTLDYEKLAKTVVDQWNKTVDNLSKAWDAVSNSFVGQLVGGIINDLGIKDFCVGLYKFAEGYVMTAYNAVKTVVNLATDLAMVATGQMSAKDMAARFKQNCKDTFNSAYGAVEGLAQGTWGLIQGIGEVTGVSDVCRGVANLAEFVYKGVTKGEWDYAKLIEGTIQLAMGVVQVYLCVQALVDGGAGLAAMQGFKAMLKSGTKVALKEGAEILMKEVCEKAAKECMEKIGKEVLEKAGKECFEQFEKQVVKEFMEQGIKGSAKEIMEKGFKELSEEALGKALKNAAEKAAEKQGTKLLLDQGVDQTVKKTTKEFLDKIKSESVEKLAKEIEENALKQGKKIATEEATEMARLLKVMEKSGNKTLDNWVKESLEKTWTNALKDQMIPIKGSNPIKGAFPMRDVFSDLSKEMIDNNLKKAGRYTDDLAKRLHSKVMDGFDEGLEKAIAKIARKGIDEAFDEHRGRRRRHWGGGAEDDTKAETAAYKGAVVEVALAKQAIIEREQGKNNETVEVRHGLDADEEQDEEGSSEQGGEVKKAKDRDEDDDNQTPAPGSKQKVKL